MARAEDLDLDPNREEDPAVERILEAIEEMRSCGSYEWADDTLTGIYDTVHASRTVSEGQKRAIRNIAFARESVAEAMDLDEKLS